MITQYFLFSGRVQGVGFRYTTHVFATQLGLLGWVRNLANGQVEAVVCGELEVINRLIDQLQGQFQITDVISKDLNPENFKGFEIR